MAEGDDMIRDALEVTRNLHRLIITVSLVTIVFSLSLRFPDKTRQQREEINHFLRTDFSEYERYVQIQVNNVASRWLKPITEEIETSLNATNYLVFGLGDVVGAFKKPTLLGEFKINETKLTNPSDLTLKQLDMLADAYPLNTNVRVVLVETSALLPQIHGFISAHAKTGMRIQSANLQTSETYLATEAPNDGEQIKMLLSFELMPNGGPPSPVFQGVFDATVRSIPNTSFKHWIAQRSDLNRLVTIKTNSLKWLPSLDEMPRELVDRRLGDVLGALNEELKKGSPESKSVSLLGTEIPGVLLIYATPLSLVSLSYYFLFHLTHLCRFASRHKLDCERFAWLPLSLETGWIWESFFSLGLLPLLSLVVLNAQLWRFHYLEWGPGLFAFVAAVFAVFLTQRSIAQIGRLRGQIGKSAKAHLWHKSRQ